MELQHFRLMMEAAYPTVRPDEFDVVINDIRQEDVANIGAMLEVQDLNDATGPGAFPTRGIMYGSGNYRRIFSGDNNKNGVAGNQEVTARSTFSIRTSHSRNCCAQL